MAKGAWAEATKGANSTFSRNKALEDAKDAATAYDDATVDYDSITVYYDGYDPTGLTAEGETNATWAKVSE